MKKEKETTIKDFKKQHLSEIKNIKINYSSNFKNIKIIFKFKDNENLLFTNKIYKKIKTEEKTTLKTNEKLLKILIKNQIIINYIKDFENTNKKTLKIFENYLFLIKHLFITDFFSKKVDFQKKFNTEVEIFLESHWFIVKTCYSCSFKKELNNLIEKYLINHKLLFSKYESIYEHNETKLRITNNNI